MSEKPWLVAVVAIVLLLAVLVMVRRGVQPLPDDTGEALSPVHTPVGARRARAAEKARDGSDEGFGRASAPIRVGAGEQRAAAAAVRPVGTPRPVNPEANEVIPEPTTGEGAMVVKPKMSLSFDGSTHGADGTAPIKADGVEQDEALGATRFSPLAAVMYPDSGGVDTSAGSIVFWVHMEWDPAEPERRSKTLAELRAGGWANRIEVNLGPPLIGSLFTNSDGVEQSVAAHITWQQGEWHHVGVTWGDSVGSIYIDAVLRDQRELVGTIEIPPGTPLYVGSTYNIPLRANQGAVALRGWQVFQEVLSPDDIGAIMVQTAPPAG